MLQYGRSWKITQEMIPSTMNQKNITDTIIAFISFCFIFSFFYIQNDPGTHLFASFVEKKVNIQSAYSVKGLSVLEGEGRGVGLISCCTTKSPSSTGADHKQMSAAQHSLSTDGDLPPSLLVFYFFRIRPFFRFILRKYFVLVCASQISFLYVWVEREHF